MMKRVVNIMVVMILMDTTKVRHCSCLHVQTFVCVGDRMRWLCYYVTQCPSLYSGASPFGGSGLSCMTCKK